MAENANDIGSPMGQVIRRDRIAVSVKEAARISGLSRAFLYQELESRLKSYKRRGRRIIMLDDLESYLRSED